MDALVLISEVKKIFKEIEENKFEVKLTVGGSTVIIFTRGGNGMKPLIGMYYSGEEWIPCSWSKEGWYIPDQELYCRRDLDLLMEDEQPKEAA